MILAVQRHNFYLRDNEDGFPAFDALACGGSKLVSGCPTDGVSSDWFDSSAKSDIVLTSKSMVSIVAKPAKALLVIYNHIKVAALEEENAAILYHNIYDACYRCRKRVGRQLTKFLFAG